ncbi:hypothetical protein AAZX31_05G229500 [Glycine max]
MPLCHHGNHYFSVWQMKESWTTLLNVNCEHFQIFNSYCKYRFPLCISEDRDILLLSSNEVFEVITYNRRDNRLEYTDISSNKVWLHSSDYVESLVLPYCN